jgi:hypothetical protein
MLFNANKYTRWYYEVINRAKPRVSNGYTEERKAKMSASAQARWTEEERNKMRAPKPKYVCEHCNATVGGKANYNRWHGDNCKLRIGELLCRG